MWATHRRLRRRLRVQNNAALGGGLFVGFGETKRTEAFPIGGDALLGYVFADESGGDWGEQDAAAEVAGGEEQPIYICWT
jgi:hypothetical protein